MIDIQHPESDTWNVLGDSAVITHPNSHAYFATTIIDLSKSYQALLERQVAEEPIKIFYSYSRKDLDMRNTLEDHLSALREAKRIETWHDLQLEAGTEWEPAILDKLDTADIILLLISSSFIASKYCYGTELKRAIVRHDAGKARVIPIILRDCDWNHSYVPFSKLNVLPDHAEPITSKSWAEQDAAFTIVARRIRETVDELTKKKLAEQQAQEQQRQAQIAQKEAEQRAEQERLQQEQQRQAEEQERVRQGECLKREAEAAVQQRQQELEQQRQELASEEGVKYELFKSVPEKLISHPVATSSETSRSSPTPDPRSPSSPTNRPSQTPANGLTPEEILGAVILFGGTGLVFAFFLTRIVFGGGGGFVEGFIGVSFGVILAGLFVLILGLSRNGSRKP